MSGLTVTLGMMALLGSALTGGVFFAFSSFIMKALAQAPSEQGIATMQSINITVITPSFMGVFLGTAVLSLVILILVLLDQNQGLSSYFLWAAMTYFVGTFLVTMVANVPLNNKLATITQADPAELVSWEHYLNRWTVWNHIRTTAAALAVMLFTFGLIGA